MQDNFPKNTRFADLSLQISWAIIALTVSLFVYGIYVNEPIIIDASKPGKGEDLKCYRAIVERIHNEEGYYHAADQELRTRGYPTRSVFNWRLPFLALFLGNLPSISIGQTLALLLSGVTVILWIFVLKRNFSFGYAAIGSVLLLGILINSLIKDVFLTHEFWAGTLIVLSLIAFSQGWTFLSISSGILALFIRELSIPFVGAMMFAAFIERHYRESICWLLGILVFFLILGIHSYIVSNLITDANIAQKEGWIALGGWTFVLKTIQFHPFLISAPSWITPMFVPLSILGLVGWKGPLGSRVALIVGAYILSYLFVGKPFNIYWGVMFNTLVFLGVLYIPRSIFDLWRSISRQSSK